MDRKTYKEKIVVKETPEEIIEIIKAISIAKVDINSNVIPHQNLNQQQANTISEEEQYK